MPNPHITVKWCSCPTAAKASHEQNAFDRIRTIRAQLHTTQVTMGAVLICLQQVKAAMQGHQRPNQTSLQMDMRQESPAVAGQGVVSECSSHVDDVERTSWLST
jgi:hypothetical protein